MPAIHLSRELLWAALQGRTTPQQLVLDHLLDACSYCRWQIEAFQRELRALPSMIAAQGATNLARQDRKAERELQELLARPHEERLKMVRQARVRFRTAALVRRLLKESEGRIFRDPEEARQLADLAGAVTRLSPRIFEAFALMALASAYAANAHRVAGLWPEAEEQFKQARTMLRVHGVTDPAVVARVAELEGSLRKRLRSFAESEALFLRALLLYRVAADRVGEARTLLALGTLYNLQGEPRRAADTTRAALGRVRQDREQRLYMIGRYNLARYLIGAGDHQAAAGLLDSDADLYRQFPEPWMQLRLTWLRGKIAAGLGQTREAEQAFLEARAGFIQSGHAFDAAMVSAEDLALLYLEQGRTEDVKRLAEEMLAIFQAQNVQRETLAAVVLFQEAARRQEVTLALIRDLAEALRSGDASGQTP